MLLPAPAPPNFVASLFSEHLGGLRRLPSALWTRRQGRWGMAALCTPVIMVVMAIASPTRQDLVRRGQGLEYFTIGYNSLEGLVSIVAGFIAGSVSLIGFGLDSIIEVASGAALLWRLHHDLDHSSREQMERTSLRIVGGCFLALALYILYESGSTLIRHEATERSIPGIIVAAASVVVMPLLARAKRRVAAGIKSGAMRADSRQADFCTYLSAILLGGLLLNALLGWWWADPVAGVVMVPIIAKEGMDGVMARPCCDSCGNH
jgi:divalent metal cation (Fe/Co/Zn/Cd) transporter